MDSIALTHHKRIRNPDKKNPQAIKCSVVDTSSMRGRALEEPEHEVCGEIVSPTKNMRRYNHEVSPS